MYTCIYLEHVNQQDMKYVGHNYIRNAYHIDTKNDERKSHRSSVSLYLCAGLYAMESLHKKDNNADSFCRSRPRNVIDTHYNKFEYDIDGLTQERRNYIAYAMELRLSCTDPSIW